MPSSSEVSTLDELSLGASCSSSSSEVEGDMRGEESEGELDADPGRMSHFPWAQMVNRDWGVSLLNMLSNVMVVS